MATEFDNRRCWGPEPHYPKVLAFGKEPPNPSNLEQKPPFNARSPIILAGPCSIESSAQIEEIAKEISKCNITFMRGGVFRAGTYPPKEYGLKQDLLKAWREIASNYSLKIVVEVLDYRQLELLDQYADCFQVGARACQNYQLLVELSNQNKPVTLKRHPGISLDEFLGACEYLLSGRGHPYPILIERGSVSHSKHVRWALDVSMIAAIKRMTKIPILVDASHASGRRDLVEPLTLAGLAAGADGFLVEVHPNPQESISDADQAISIEDFNGLMEKIERMKR